jgi:hypothetical protein
MKVKGKILKITMFIMAGFILLFIFRLIYGYTSKFKIREDDYFGDFFDTNMSKRNYASSKYEYSKSGKGSWKSQTNKPKNGGFEQTPTKSETFDVDQKYEKTAEIKSKSKEWEKVKKTIEDSIQSFGAIIQYENKSGSNGYRKWNISVGVQPDRFDEFYNFMTKVARLRSAEVTKIDKTNEFNNLNAKRVSLEKIRNSLLDLKRQSGKIDEFVNLENRILEIESQLQELGVLLGDFDEEHEFCTVKFSLLEGRKPVPPSFLHRLKVAFEWTVKLYLQFLVIVTLALFSSFFILLIFDKLKILSGVIKKLNE